MIQELRGRRIKHRIAVFSAENTVHYADFLGPLRIKVRNWNRSLPAAAAALAVYG